MSSDRNTKTQENPSTSTTGDSNPSVLFSLADDEDAQLAQFDRYLETDGDAIPVSTMASLTGNADASTTVTSNSVSAPLELLTKAYPSYDQGAISAVLESCNNDIDATRRILNDSSQPIDSTQAAATPASSTAGATRSGEPDNSQSDAALAEYLQNREQLHAARRRAMRFGRPARLSNAAMQRLLSSLREIVVPALRAHFEELVLPDTRDESSALVYELHNVQVAALSLPTENVSVRAAADSCRVLVNVVSANLELEVGRWSYENLGFVPVKDTGSARASVHGLNIDIRLEPRESTHGPAVVAIIQCDVTVDGVVRFKIQGAAADWAYNAIAVLFKPWLVAYVKETVSDAVVRALSVHLRQLEIAAAADPSIVDLNSTVSAQPPHAPQHSVSATE